MKATFAWLVIASGLQFPEGPVWGPDGKLYLSSCNTPAVCRVDAKDKWVKYCEIGCNGLAFDAEGMLIVCDPKLKRIARIDKDGKEHTLVDKFEGQPLNGPNDLTIAADGAIYLTDPQGDPKAYEKGAVYRLTKDGKLSLIARPMRYPNGIELRPDGKSLVVASTVDKAIYEIALGPGGRPGEPKKWCDLTPLGEQVGPDGMAFDEKGNLYVAVFGASCVAKIDSNGKVTERFKTPGKNPTNCCFGGKDYRTLYATETVRNELLAAEMPVAGLRPAWERATAASAPSNRAAAASSSDATRITIKSKVLPDGRLLVSGDTSLPFGTELVVTAEEPVWTGFVGQANVNVQEDGSFNTGALGPIGGIEKGKYLVEVVMPVPSVQPPHVRKIIGENGENLRGPLVEKDTLGVTVKATVFVTVGGDGAEEAQRQRLRQRLDRHRSMYNKLRKLEADLRTSEHKSLDDQAWGRFARGFRKDLEAIRGQLDTRDTDPVRMSLAIAAGDLLQRFLDSAFQRGDPNRKADQNIDVLYREQMREARKHIDEMSKSLNRMTGQ